MNGNWNFYNPVRVYFGRGCRGFITRELLACAPLVVTTARGREQLTSDPVLSEWVNSGEIYWADTVQSNPDIKDIGSEIVCLGKLPFKSVVAFGGGSVIDTAKVLAVALSDRLKGRALSELLTQPDLYRNARPCPLYVMPTTAGTGSEVTPFATVWDHSKHKKHSLAGDVVFPYAALVDPDLTDSLPRDVTMFTGLDAINQAAESIWNKNATPITIELAMRALQLGLSALPKIIEGRGEGSEREHMAECSLLAGLAISQTRTALCHSISYPLTTHFAVPHGLACAFTMSAVLNLNLSSDDGRFERLAKHLKGDNANARDLVSIFAELHGRLNVCNLVKERVGKITDLIALSDEMFTLGRADNNLIAVNSAIIKDILDESWCFSV